MDEFNSGERNSVDDNLLAALCYWLCCGFPALIIFILKKEESSFIRFHSLQALALILISLLVCLPLSFGLTVILMVPVIGPIIYGLVSIVMMVLCFALLGYVIFVGIKAYNGEEYEIPILGSFIQEKFMS